MPQACPFISGEWITFDRTETEIVDPYSGTVIGKMLTSTSEDVEQALLSAQGAKQKIARIPSVERANILKRAATLVLQERERLAFLMAVELGKPLKNCLEEVARSAETLEISGEEAKRLTGETLPGHVSSRGSNATAVTYRVPVGVVAAITPFNAPLNLICHKVGPAFAAGNVTILKPAPQTSLIATELVKLLLTAGLPGEAIHLLLGGPDIGSRIVADDRVNVISFTGGVGAGRSICQAAGMKRVLLELGGNAATIVHADADIERAASICSRTGFSNSGQSCISVQRIYVHQSVAESFTERLRAYVVQLRVGNPTYQDTDVGCLVNESAARRVEEWVQEAIQMGATLVCGGNRSGATLYPTVLFNAPSNSKVVCEEVFGPVVAIVPYDDFEEALQMANDSPYGLQAGVFTNRLDLAHQAVDTLEVGGVILNGSSNFRIDHWPYGGIKDSGLGREGPRFAVEEMTELKMVVYQYS